MVTIDPEASDDTVRIELGTMSFEIEQKYIDDLREDKPSDMPLEEAIERCIRYGARAAERGDPEMIQMLENADSEQ